MNVVVAFLVAFVTQILVRKSIRYMAKEFISDISPAFIMSCIVVIVVRLITLLPIKAVWILIIQIVAGIVVYLICSICTRNQSFMFLWGYISKILKKETQKKMTKLLYIYESYEPTNAEFYNLILHAKIMPSSKL